MRIWSSVGAAFGIFGFLCAAWSPPSIAGQPANVRKFAAKRHGTDVPSPGPTPQFATCMSSSGTNFVGISGVGSEAEGGDAGVMGGTYDEACQEYSAIGGGQVNAIDPQNGCSQEYDFIGAGSNNYLCATEAFIGAGLGNDGGGYFIGIGAGEGNNASFTTSFVGSGYANDAEGSGSFIGGGGYTSGYLGGGKGFSDITEGNDSFAGAGDQNVVTGATSFIGSGMLNTSSGLSSVIVGGNNNDVSGTYGAIGGGSGNRASGAFASIPGGADNEALGPASFAAGFHAEAAHAGSFVWSDDVSGSSLVSDTAANQFVVRASGGTTISSNESASAGVTLAAGSGAWASLSDRHAKSDVVPVDDASLLARVASLPISSWRYQTEPGVRHIGPMAQDFYAAFGAGDDDRHIASIDEDGVALAAVKALRRKSVAVALENAGLRDELAMLARAKASTNAAVAAREARERRTLDALHAQVASLERRMRKLEASGKAGN